MNGRFPAAIRRGVVLLIFLLAAACGEVKSSVPQQEQGPLYIPPTLAVTPTPLIAPQSTLSQSAITAPQALTPEGTPAAQAAGACSSGLTYLEDLTIPDGSKAAPGERLDKRWKVKNSGGCNWDERYRLRLTAGPSLGAAEEQALYPALSGTEAEVRILFNAPQEAGSYRSAWQAYDPDGQPFGDPVFIDFEVVAPKATP